MRWDTYSKLEVLFGRECYIIKTQNNKGIFFMKIFSLLLFLSLSLMAQNSEWFVGIEGGATAAKLTEESLDRDYQLGAQYGLRAGVRENNSRIYIGYNTSQKVSDDISSSHNLYLALEGISDEFTVIAESTAKFFMGVHLGSAFSDINGSNVTSVMGGVQIGLDFMLPGNFEIETAYRHYWTYRKEETNFIAGSVYGGLNYKFHSF